METIETVINWLTFINMMPFMFFGLLVHTFKKFALARTKEGYSFGQFVYKNWTAWGMSVFYSLIGCFLWNQGIEVFHGTTWSVAALLIGLSGGSLGKGTVKGLLSLASKNGTKG